MGVNNKVLPKTTEMEIKTKQKLQMIVVDLVNKILNVWLKKEKNMLKKTEKMQKK